MPARYILAILGSIAMAIVYGLKVNLSVAMVAMLNHTAIKLSSDVHNQVLTKNLTHITLPSNEESCGSDDTSGAQTQVCISNYGVFDMISNGTSLMNYENAVASEIGIYCKS